MVRMDGRPILDFGILKNFLGLLCQYEKQKEGTCLFVITCYFSPTILSNLLENLIEKTTIYYDQNGLINEIPQNTKYKYFGVEIDVGLFHPKMYYYEGVDTLLLITSSNFTNGSFQNYEGGFLLKGDAAKEYWTEIHEKILMLKMISDRERLNQMVMRSDAKMEESNDKWIHQELAKDIFLREHRGILEMATGTGKTRTAIKIFNELIKKSKIDGTIITTFGTDLLDQWHKEILLGITEFHDFAVYRQYDKYKELSNFLVHPEKSILLISKDFLGELLDRKNNDSIRNKLLICDEVHRMGSKEIREILDGKLGEFPYILGLSATPDREYDENGNDFVESQIGPVIYRFGLEEAIQRGILCEFDYVPLMYELNDDDKRKLKNVYARYYGAKKQNPIMGKEQLFMDLAKVRKLSISKFDVFKEYLRKNPHILERTIIFVETMEYGKTLQEIVINYKKDYHTYYGGDDRLNLKQFAQNNLACLITCKRISEGIDIQSVNNIILFSASRAKLETIQRIGRCLRIDRTNPDKRSMVIDFVLESELSAEPDEDYEPADLYRFNWLSSLSKIRRIRDD
jgi:superfamily II DNA or RNA helicase